MYLDKTGILMLPLSHALVQSRPRTMSIKHRSQARMKLRTQVKAPEGIVTATEEGRV